MALTLHRASTQHALMAQAHCTPIHSWDLWEVFRRCKGRLLGDTDVGTMVKEQVPLGKFQTEEKIKRMETGRNGYSMSCPFPMRVGGAEDLLSNVLRGQPK